MLIERKILTEGWTSFQDVEFGTFDAPVEIKDVTILINYSKKYKVQAVCVHGFSIAITSIVYKPRVFQAAGNYVATSRFGWP